MQQRNLEALFQEVSDGVQKKAEGWNITKALKGAVGEVKRNVNSFHSASPDREASNSGTTESTRDQMAAEAHAAELRGWIQDLETRNKVLAKMLDAALESLRSLQPVTASTSTTETDDVFNLAMAKIQFVAVYLANPDIPIPDDKIQGSYKKDFASSALKSRQSRLPEPEPRQIGARPPVASVQQAMPARSSSPSQPGSEDERFRKAEPKPKPKVPRPSLADSSFSFMLGENRHRSSFVSSVSDLPEQRRDSESKGQTKQLWTEDNQEHKPAESEDDGFTLSSLRGAHRR